MFDVIFSGTNEEQVEKAKYFEVGLKQRMKEEATSFAMAVVSGGDGAIALRYLSEMRRAHEEFGKDPRLAELNAWVEKDNAEQRKKMVVEAITDHLLSHIR